MDIIFTAEDILPRSRNKPTSFLSLRDIWPHLVKRELITSASSVFCVTNEAIVSFKNRKGRNEIIYHSKPDVIHNLSESAVISSSTPSNYDDSYSYPGEAYVPTNTKITDNIHVWNTLPKKSSINENYNY